MEKVGISFRSRLSSEEVNERYIRPLRQALQRESAGIYSNYLRENDPATDDPTEHLLVFEVNDFKEGLRCLRLEAERIGMPEDLSFQNLNPSDPSY